MKHRVAPLILLLVMALFASSAMGANAKKKDPNKGYRFTVFIYDCPDTILYLGNYYLGGTYAIDTAVLNKKGLFVFEKKEVVLKPGLYFFSSPSGNYVEFAVYNNEKLDIHFDTEEPGWQSNMHVKGSKENEILFSFHQKNRAIYKSIDSVKASGVDSVTYENFRRSQMLRLDSIKYSYLDTYPNSLLALLMNASREPEVPEVDSNGNTMSQQQRWEYFMDHYFDYTKLDDDAIVRTPDLVFSQRLKRYFDVYMKNAPPETIIKYADKIIEKASPSKETFKYLVHTISEKYLQSNIMSYDAIYVHMVKKYIEPGLCDWMSPSAVDMNVKRANTWDKLLIGKPAPPLIMRDDKGNIQSLYNLPNKYTLLVFWSPTCGHCKTVIPDLYKRFEKYRTQCDIAAYAVLSEPDESTRPKWRDFIDKHGLDWMNIDGGEANIDWHEVYDIETTPQIFLLDKDKKIIAKRLGAESFEEIIKYFEGIQ